LRGLFAISARSSLALSCLRVLRCALATFDHGGDCAVDRTITLSTNEIADAMHAV